MHCFLLGKGDSEVKEERREEESGSITRSALALLLLSKENEVDKGALRMTLVHTRRKETYSKDNKA